MKTDFEYWMMLASIMARREFGNGRIQLVQYDQQPCYMMDMSERDPAAGDDEGRHCELKIDGFDQFDTGYDYHVSHYFPYHYPVDPDGQICVIAQWKGPEDSGNNERRPNVAIRTANREGQEVIECVVHQQTGEHPNYDSHIVWSVPLVREQWYEWAFQIFWSLGDDGLFRTWLGGEKLNTFKGRNCHDDYAGPFFKCGIYSSGWENFPHIQLFLKDTKRRQVT